MNTEKKPRPKRMRDATSAEAIETYRLLESVAGDFRLLYEKLTNEAGDDAFNGVLGKVDGGGERGPVLVKALSRWVSDVANAHRTTAAKPRPSTKKKK